MTRGRLDPVGDTRHTSITAVRMRHQAARLGTLETRRLSVVSKVPGRGLHSRRRLGRSSQIVVGYSGTPDAEHALQWAARVAEPIGAAIHIIQAVPLGAVPFLASPDAIARALRKNVADARESAELAASQLRARGLRVTTSARSWLSSESVLESASEVNADLIVTGRRRGHRLAHLFEGSISSQVVRLARGDVLVAIGPPPRGAGSKVLVGIDGSLNSVRALRAARRIFPSAVITALFVVHTGEISTAKTILGNAAAAAGLRADEVHAIVRRGHPARKIVDEIKDGGHDVLVVGRRGMGPFKELLVGSICDKLLHLSPVSMLVVK